VLDLHTTRSWDFMRVNPSPSGRSGILTESRFGEDSIIGVLDTGETAFSSVVAADKSGLGNGHCNVILMSCFLVFRDMAGVGEL
jgi:hypothetical protein